MWFLCYKVCKWLAAGRWFSLGTPVSSIKTNSSYNEFIFFLSHWKILFCLAHVKYVVSMHVSFHYDFHALRLCSILLSYFICFIIFDYIFIERNYAIYIWLCDSTTHCDCGYHAGYTILCVAFLLFQ
jgi:hypothetical protein